MAYCANCGTELQEGYEFCPECGQAVSNNSTSAYNGKFKTCKNCGEQMPEDAFYCLGCGMTFDAQEIEFDDVKSRVLNTGKPQKRVVDTSVGVWKNKWVSFSVCLAFIVFMRKRKLLDLYIYLHSDFLAWDGFSISSFLLQKQIHIG